MEGERGVDKKDEYHVWHWICSRCRRDNVHVLLAGVEPLPLLREAYACAGRGYEKKGIKTLRQIKTTWTFYIFKMYFD